MTRRKLLSGVTYAAATLAAGVRSAATSAQADGHPLATAFDTDAVALDEAAVDFGHILSRRPRAVARPSSVADVAAVMQWAGERGLKAVARGEGHSTYGRSMAEDGIVIDMSGLDAIQRVEPDRIVVGAGATWDAVLDAALSQGLAPPVLTNYLGLSVGGTLAVGGIGGSTSRHGMQTDNVLELEVVTGAGRTLTASAERSPDLFDAVRGGLGEVAVITRATLRLINAPERVLRIQLFYPDLNSLTRDQRLVLAEGRFDQLQGAILPDGTGGWRYQLEGAVFYEGSKAPDRPSLLAGLSDDRDQAEISDLTYREDARAFARLESLLRSNGQWSNPHPWWLTFLPGSNAEELAAEILWDLTNDDVGPFGRITCYPMLTDALGTPLVRMPGESIAFPFNIIRMPASNDRTDVKRMVASNKVLYERVRKRGGVLYPVSAFPMSAADWRDHFGPAWPLLYAAEQRYDPRHTLATGYEVF